MAVAAVVAVVVWMLSVAPVRRAISVAITSQRALIAAASAQAAQVHGSVIHALQPGHSGESLSCSAVMCCTAGSHCHCCGCCGSVGNDVVRYTQRDGNEQRCIASVP
eukprot:7752-Heterococcus_DN1.PRE.1